MNMGSQKIIYPAIIFTVLSAVLLMRAEPKKVVPSVTSEAVWVEDAKLDKTSIKNDTSSTVKVSRRNL